MSNLTFQEWFDREVRGLPEDEIKKPGSEAKLFDNLESLMPDPQLRSDPLITCKCLDCGHMFKADLYYMTHFVRCPLCSRTEISKSI